MNEEVKQKVAKLLNEASKLLVNSGPQPTTSGTSPSVRNDDAPSGSSSASSLSPLGETLHRAQSMLQASSSSGLFRRLNRTE